jgi:hypothetical protein
MLRGGIEKKKQINQENDSKQKKIKNKMTRNEIKK